jgi:stage IV sporulation protein A
MEKFDIYNNIAMRLGGNIFIGVVGPVRTGKSTFITKFVNGLILPNISDDLSKKIALDEMPQSADGKTVMTNQPKFIPSNAVRVELSNKVFANVRLVDCVGYMVDGAIGHEEDGKPRYVKTPWSDEEIPFEVAAEIGTKKVIMDYSTIGIVVTTDGSFGDIKRESFVPAEERVVSELKALKKPFIIVLNVLDVTNETSINLKNSLEKKYGVPVVLCNALNLNTDDITKILERVLYEFPMYSYTIDLPKWMQGLQENNEVIKRIILDVKENSKSIEKMKDFSVLTELYVDDEKLSQPTVLEVDLSKGEASYFIDAKPGLFYEVLSSECEDCIADEFELLNYVKSLSKAKKEYSRLRYALESADSLGYGITSCSNDLVIEEPTLLKQGNKYGVKFKATSSTLHIIKVDVSTEVSPIVGGKEQSEELLDGLLSDYSENPKKILSTNIFGKTLDDLINDGLNRKSTNITQDTQSKMRKTVTRIVNEGKGGVICILL